MALTAKRFLRISKAKHREVECWREDISIQRDSGTEVADLLLRVAAVRWKLASVHLRQAKASMSIRNPLYRAAVSRFYYAMYQAMRACVFVAYDGDDHESHDQLPLKVPKDFPHPDVWQTKLKSARLERNAANYDPYPQSDKAWSNAGANSLTR